MNYVAAILYAASSSVLVAMLLAFIFGGLSPNIAGASLAAGSAVAGFGIWRTRHERPHFRELNRWEWTVVVIFALFTLRAFLWLVFRADDTIQVLSPNNLGDLSLHLTYIHYLSNGVPFWPENPICTGTPLTYPLGADLFNALLTLLGIDTLRGLIWVGLIGCACTGLALWRWGGAFVMAGFLFNGGLFGFAIFGTGVIADYQAEMAWKSLPLALLVTQRGLLFALPAGLLLLTSWRARYFADDDAAWRLPLWGEVLLYASMPIFHLHTFLFLSLLLAAWFVMQPSARKPLLNMVGAAFLPATLLVLLVTGRFQGAAMVGGKIGWMSDDPAWLTFLQQTFGAVPWPVAPAMFWLFNFGILPVLVVWLCVRLFREKNFLWLRAFIFPALAVFLLCCFVSFAPWEWDNTKLMIWSYLIVLPFLWSHLLAQRPFLLRAAACALLFFSGFVSLLGGISGVHTGYEIARRSELDGVLSAVRNLPPSHRFAGYPTFNHPLLLAGRPMALGYHGHLWSHGLPWKEPSAHLEALMNGAPGWRDHATALDVRFIFWGAEERENYPGSTQPWRTTATRIAAGEWGEIFDLAAPLSGAPSAANAPALPPCCGSGANFARAALLR